MKSFFTLLLFASFSISHAQPGTLDLSFGREGRQWDTTAHYARYPAMLVQTDGKIIIGGQGFSKKNFSKTFGITRLLKNGKPDVTFGDKGNVFVDFSLSKNETNHSSAITCMALQPDGKIVAGGYYATSSFSESKFLVIRFLPSGSIDSSFGINGIAIPKVKGYGNTGNAMLVQPDGKIVIGGTYTPILFDDLFFVERLLPNGSFDVSFGDSGQIVNNYGNAQVLALQPDGKIVAAGYNGSSFGYVHFLIRRYLPNGTPDKLFGNKGTVDTVIGNQTSYISDLALQPDGKIVIAGGTYVYPGYPHFTVGRYNSNGSIDKSFGNGGISITLFSDYDGDALADARKVMLWNDKIIAVGYKDAVNASYTNQSDVTMVAYKNNGVIDSSFGTNGIQDINIDYNEYLASAALQQDGKIVLLDLSQDYGQTYEVRNVLRYYGYPAQLFTNRTENNSMIAVSPITSSLRVYPNPVSDYVIVTGLNTSTRTTIAITDGLGKTITAFNTDYAAQYKFDVSKLTAGIYYIQVNAGGKAETLPFLKE